VSELALAIASASSRVAADSSAAGTTRLTRPHSAAVAASIASPVSSICMARLRPMARVKATIGVVQKRPMFTPGVAKRASSLATTRSQVAASWQPAAVAMPCTCAITGCGIAWIAVISSTQRSNTRRYVATSRSISSRRSCPAQNAGPLPDRITARVSRRSPAARTAAMSSPMWASESALRRSGRFMVMCVIARSTSTRMCSYVMAFLLTLRR
jgi:hypothetical protein